MTALTARDLVKAKGGDWSGDYGLLPGPGHSPRDRSLKVWQSGDRILVHSFAGDDWRDCRAYLGLDDDYRPDERRPRRTAKPSAPPAPAKPTARVRDLCRTATSPDLVPDVVSYLTSRNLWPLPAGCTLKAHTGAEYWEAGDPPKRIGSYPALLAEVTDILGDLTTLHVTYLHHGRKLEDRTARKLLSATRGHAGCAVRLVPVEGTTLGLAEGIESALAAMHFLQIPVWAALNTSLLKTFEPPAGIEKLVICADRDGPGLEAAWHLRDRLAMNMELRLPRRADWAKDLGGSN